MPILIVEDDPAMAECIALAAGKPARIASDAYKAIDEMAEELPELIILDILLSGPDGFTLLNELVSYNDTAEIPVIIVTSLNLEGRDLSHYGVRAILNKETMTPKEIREAVCRAI